MEADVADGVARGSVRCFLCPFGDHPCDVASVEGRILRLADHGLHGTHPIVLLQEAGGDEVAIVLPEHARPLVALLRDLPAHVLRALSLRVFHLLRSGVERRSDAEARRVTLRGTPVSALVFEPDVLLNITDINAAEYCVRQYPLRRMAPSPPTAATLRGTVLHAALRGMLKGEPGEPRSHLERAIRAAETDLALRQFSADMLAAEAEPHLDALAAWHAAERSTLWDAGLEVRAETFLLAPEVGLKGRLDFLLQDARGGALIELKTGQVRADPTSLPKREHRWQVYGYQTLLAVRRPAEARRSGATLLYSGTPHRAASYGVPFALRELHRVLDLRNQLVLTHATGHVPPPPGAAKCGRCTLRRTCLRASRLLDWVPPPGDERAERDGEEAIAASIAEADAAWFATAYEQLRIEGRAAEAQSTALWRLTPQQRCDAGMALGGLELEGEPRATPGGEWEYTFRCANASELREGDEVLLSDGDPVRGAVVTGTILRLGEHAVAVWTPERVAHPRLLDRYASDIVHDRTVRNLWRWLGADARLRALVAGRRAPTFATDTAPVELPDDLNEEQRDAVHRALAARDFLLIQGPPGTGKTRVAAEIARRAVARGERVLLAAFTNQAVDNVLRRLASDGMHDFVRLGHELSVAPALRAHRLAERARLRQAAGDTDTPDPEALRAMLQHAPLVATTTATWSAERYDEAGEPLAFDLALVDEASQVTLPALLGALRFAERFVLLGDECQLPPLVVSREAAASGLGRSLFVTLGERWGAAATVALRAQYRMHPVICSFPSIEFYQGRLEAAGAARTALLDLALDRREPLQPILDPDRPVVFVDVRDGAGSSKVSAAQARVARQLVLALRAHGIAADEIGVIAPYRAQVAAIRQRLSAAGEPEVAVDTVDRFQGAERRVMLVSFGGRHAVSLPTYDGRGVDFIADPHRLNVALTRAQRKLILLGDRDWLGTMPLLQRLIGSCARLYGGSGGIVRASMRER
jgi:DNA replication ATP-dependent helicase Dna2